MKKILPFIHPFLFALYPVVFLYAKNIHEYREDVVIVPSILVLIFAGIVLGLLQLVTRKIERAAIITSAFVLSSLSYSRLIAVIDEHKPSIDPKYLALTCIIIFVAAACFVAFKYTKQLLSFNKFLSYLSLVLVLLSLWTIVSFEMKTKRIFTPPPAPPVHKTTKKITPPKDAPDIYYMIFDRYAGPKSLAEQYHFDNSKFLNFLNDKGFYVAKEAKTNYPKTFLSVGSSIDMKYLDELTTKTNGGASADESLATPYIQNGTAIRFLRDRGYYMVNIGPKTWTPTSSNPYADKNFIIQKGTYPYVDIFTTGFLNTTLAAPVLSRVFHNPLDVSEDPNNNEHRKVEVYELGAIKEASKIKGPKFVFMHVLIPHDPFVFDQNCQPINEKQVDQHTQVQNYLNQLRCANTKIEDTVNTILKNSKRPPVIILQSDEGPFPMKKPISEDQSWATADTTALREKFPILNAYYFPGKKTDDLYQSITPVNSFRVLFNTYFGTNYSLLPDKNYIFQDEKNYYKFTDVTDRVK
jgi:hypothetical protein